MAITYTTWNPSDKAATITLSNGNLTAVVSSDAGIQAVRSILSISTGKYYWEITVDSGYANIGIGTVDASLANEIGTDIYGYGFWGADGRKYHNGINQAYGSIFNSGIIGVALDLDNGKIWWSRNGSWQASGNPGAGTNEAFSGVSGIFHSMFSSYQLNGQVTANFGASAFSYSVPSGFNSGLYESEDDEIIFPYPLSTTASLQSNIQIELVPNILQVESSMSASEPFWGSFVECPSPFGSIGTLQAKTGLEVLINPFIAQTNIQSNLQIELVAPSFAAQSKLSVGEIFWGYQIDLPESFSSNGSLQTNAQIELATAPLIATSALLSNIGIEISAGALNTTVSILAIPVYPIVITGAKRIYLFTLTGAADGVDDIVIPIKSFQSRLKSGDPTYLSVVIPGTDYASAINLRLNGDLVVRMGYISGGGIILSEIISIVDFENIIIYDGTTNKSITLDGHRTETFTPKEIDLTGSSYKNITAGKLRYRCTPNLYVRPGDTVNIDNDSFTIENITYSVSPELETFEVSE